MIPKLKLESINEAIKLNSYRGLLQEFQYGTETVQTTTNISKKVHRNVDEVRELYSLNK